VSTHDHCPLPRKRHSLPPDDQEYIHKGRLIGAFFDKKGGPTKESDRVSDLDRNLVPPWPDDPKHSRCLSHIERLDLPDPIRSSQIYRRICCCCSIELPLIHIYRTDTAIVPIPSTPHQVEAAALAAKTAEELRRESEAAFPRCNARFSDVGGEWVGDTREGVQRIYGIQDHNQYIPSPAICRDMSVPYLPPRSSPISSLTHARRFCLV